MWFNALIESAGGSIIEENADDPENIELGLDTPSRARAAEVMQLVAESEAGGAAFSTAGEDAIATELRERATAASWSTGRSSGRAPSSAVEAGTLDPSVPDDYGWALYPRVDEDRPSRAALRRDQHRRRRVQRARRPRLRGGRVHRRATRTRPTTSSPTATRPSTTSVYDDPEVLEAFPHGAGHPGVPGAGGARGRRPPTTARSPAAIQRAYHPPAAVDPARPGQQADDLITAVLAGEQLL